jgi:enediyne biosynthesis protein E4
MITPKSFLVRIGIAVFGIVAILYSCKSKKQQEVLFEVLEQDVTGLNFSNVLTPVPEFNMFKYMYFYNGAGIGAGDFNGDGRIDLFFASNQQQNKLYLNKGDLKFSDVTPAAAIPNDKGWSTGVSVADVNSDGLLDIYVCRVGNFESLQSHNQLLINQGVNKDGLPVFRDQAAEYGLDFSGFSTQAAFFDYDLDGDLDMYLMNHSLRFNGTFSPRNTYFNTYDSLSGDRMYRNDNNRFVDVTRETGINSSIIGYGLGIAVADINLDGYPDLYIGNDFHENDYLYINQKNGTFREELTNSIMHTSQFSMGVDVADINNDAWPEIISMDMLPADPYILKRSLGEDAYEIFNYKIRHGYNYQYARNALQLNRRNGLFSEIGLYAGVHATDWSWAPLWMDFDNDGMKDLFISNGIPKRLNDIDYVNYVSNEELQARIRNNTLQDQDMTLINKFPEIKLPNKFYRNKGNAAFDDLGETIGNDKPTFSNGAVYADLDSDGDLDVVVNNIGDPALLYKNTSNDKKQKQSVSIKLKGTAGNTQAIGARILLFEGASTRTYEKYPVRGFQSSMEIPLHIGLSNTSADSILLVWPDNTYERLSLDKSVDTISLSYRSGLPSFDYANLRNRLPNTTSAFEDISARSGFDYTHIENPFIEFDREPLIPHMVSREGPVLATGDINDDGLDDIFIGSSKGNRPAVFLQQAGGKFSRMNQPALDADSVWEETGATWVDVNGDKHPDLVLASGGNEYFGKDEHLQPRVFVNDGKGNLSKKTDAFSNIYLTASCVTAADINGDGYADLFIGGRAVPWEYGQVPTSYLLQNDGTGKFTDVTASYNKQMSKVGFVTDAVWTDADNDKDADLVISLEWGGIVMFQREGKSFTQKFITEKKGWWNFVYPADVDGDGDTDWVAGNLGTNTRLKATAERPVRLYYYDFDNNGKKEQLLTYYIGDREIPFASKEELQKQLPGLKKQFLYAEDFAKAQLSTLIGEKNLKSAEVLSADYFESCLFINEGNLRFTAQPLPWQAQLSPLRGALQLQANGDDREDLLLIGNFYENNIQMGRYDADYGSLLINRGGGKFEYEMLNALSIKGEAREIRPITLQGRKAFVIARNNDKAMIIAASNK